jgi:hypothetical protein
VARGTDLLGIPRSRAAVVMSSTLEMAVEGKEVAVMAMVVVEMAAGEMEEEVTGMEVEETAVGEKEEVVMGMEVEETGVGEKEEEETVKVAGEMAAEVKVAVVRATVEEETAAAGVATAARTSCT